MNPKQILVPDWLWQDTSVNDLAKLLWCYLLAVLPCKDFRHKELRHIFGMSHTTLLKQMKELASRGLLAITKTTRGSLSFKVLRAHDRPGLMLPTELLFDFSISPRAKWLWGVIAGIGGPFTYNQLQQLTGYCPQSLVKYVRELMDSGWLVLMSGHPDRRKAPYFRTAVNPFEIRRRAEVAELENAIKLARSLKGYSVGQLLLARMVKLLVGPGTPVVEHAELTGLENTLTGGRLHYDLYLPDYKLALEFHGPQHDGPTLKYPSMEQYQAQAHRDLLKLGLSVRQGIRVIEVRWNQLSFATLRELLKDKLPLTQDLADQWHIYTYLDKFSAQYRSKAALGQI